MNKTLTPDQVTAQEFNTHRFREGYDTDQVDDFLDQVATSIKALHEANRQLLKENLQLKNEMHA